jgi:hypothetical protein
VEFAEQRSLLPKLSYQLWILDKNSGKAAPTSQEPESLSGTYLHFWGPRRVSFVKGLAWRAKLLTSHDMSKVERGAARSETSSWGRTKSKHKVDLTLRTQKYKYRTNAFQDIRCERRRTCEGKTDDSSGRFGMEYYFRYTCRDGWMDVLYPHRSYSNSIVAVSVWKIWKIDACVSYLGRFAVVLSSRTRSARMIWRTVGICKCEHAVVTARRGLKPAPSTALFCAWPGHMAGSAVCLHTSTMRLQDVHSKTKSKFGEPV